MKCPLCGAAVVYQGAVSVECASTRGYCANGTAKHEINPDDCEFMFWSKVSTGVIYQVKFLSFQTTPTAKLETIVLTSHSGNSETVTYPPNSTEWLPVAR
jgi:hypothetical protein